MFKELYTEIEYQSFDNNTWTSIGNVIVSSPSYTDDSSIEINIPIPIDDTPKRLVMVQKVHGCMDPTAINYNSNATLDNGSCTYPVYGCMDSNASNYDSNATLDDGSCEAAQTTVSVTFQVDMSEVYPHHDGVYLAGGSFGQVGYLLSDDGDNIWSTTLELDANTQYMYKFRNQPPNGTWQGFEEMEGLISGGCTIGQFNDRFVEHCIARGSTVAVNVPRMHGLVRRL